MNNFFSKVGEMLASPFQWVSISGVRSTFRAIGGAFWPQAHPAGEGTIVNYDYTRSLYRNSQESRLGGGFARPIVDLQVGFVGIPSVTVPQSDSATTYLNECLSVYWPDEIQQMVRDSIRDSKIIVRVHRPDILDPLMTLEEAQHCRLECIPPERVDIERNFRNKNIIEKATILHRMTVVTVEGDPTMGIQPQSEEHEILEIIDRQTYRFFDQNTNTWLTDMETRNTAGIVPLLEIYHDWDAALQGGQSDLESVIPFIEAFHDVVAQGLQAHKYHSTPKVKLKLQDVAPFIKNNFPEAWDDATGAVRPGSTISWRGREIIFLNETDDMDFLEATSVLGDTKTLAEFLIDCICIASQTPEWAFMRVDSGSANSDRNAQTVPFVKKIERKRQMYVKPIQEICKIAMVMTGMIPYRAKVAWGAIRADDQVVLMQAFQQLMMGLEVARQRGEISDETYQNAMRVFLPMMGPNSQEKSEPDAPPQAALPPAEPAIRSGA